MAKDNALSFVGQIMTAYKAIMKAEGQALKYAIECGEALNLAKEKRDTPWPLSDDCWLDQCYANARCSQFILHGSLSCKSCQYMDRVIADQFEVVAFGELVAER